MRKARLCYVAVPCTQEVLDLLHILPIPYDNYTSDIGTAKDCGLFIYNERLGLEIVEADTEWLLENKDAIQVLAFYANKDFDGLCTYLNTLHKRPFNVYVNQGYLI